MNGTLPVLAGALLFAGWLTVALVLVYGWGRLPDPTLDHGEAPHPPPLLGHHPTPLFDQQLVEADWMLWRQEVGDVS